MSGLSTFRSSSAVFHVLRANAPAPGETPARAPASGTAMAARAATVPALAPVATAATPGTAPRPSPSSVTLFFQNAASNLPRVKPSASGLRKPGSARCAVRAASESPPATSMIGIPAGGKKRATAAPAAPRMDAAFERASAGSSTILFQTDSSIPGSFGARRSAVAVSVSATRRAAAECSEASSAASRRASVRASSVVAAAAWDA